MSFFLCYTSAQRCWQNNKVKLFVKKESNLVTNSVFPRCKFPPVRNANKGEQHPTIVGYLPLLPMSFPFFFCILFFLGGKGEKYVRGTKICAIKKMLSDGVTTMTSAF